MSEPASRFAVISMRRCLPTAASWAGPNTRPAALGDAAPASASGDLDASMLTKTQLIERRLAELEYPEAWGPGHPARG